MRRGRLPCAVVGRRLGRQHPRVPQDGALPRVLSAVSRGVGRVRRWAGRARAAALLRAFHRLSAAIWPQTKIAAIHPLQRTAGMDLRWVKEHYGRRFCIIGNVDSSRTLPFGTPEQVAAEAREAIDIAAPGGGYVLASDHSLHDGIPVENIRTLFRVGREYGGQFLPQILRRERIAMARFELNIDYPLEKMEQSRRRMEARNRVPLRRSRADPVRPVGAVFHAALQLPLPRFLQGRRDAIPVAVAVRQVPHREHSRGLLPGAGRSGCIRFSTTSSRPAPTAARWAGWKMVRRGPFPVIHTVEQMERLRAGRARGRPAGKSHRVVAQDEGARRRDESDVQRPRRAASTWSRSRWAS